MEISDLINNKNKTNIVVGAVLQSQNFEPKDPGVWNPNWKIRSGFTRAMSSHQLP